MPILHDIEFIVRIGDHRQIYQISMLPSLDIDSDYIIIITTSVNFYLLTE